MDIIDIMLAKAMTPQGKTEAYVAKANAAAAKAAQAEASATAAIETVEAAADEIAAAREEAASLLEEAQAVLETAQAASINLPEVYTTTGQNTDGYMTQKAVTDALATKADASALAAKADAATAATKAYVDSAIAAIPTGGGNVTIDTNLGSENSGKIVIVGQDGNITPSEITEASLVEALASGGAYVIHNALGIEVDYDNKTFKRTYDAQDKFMGSDFNIYPMYGGRKRCNVSDNGTINAFYGDSSYREDGSNGQVMIYQPKFYYKRAPIATLDNAVGKVVRKDSIIISAVSQNDFKVHPIFKTQNGEELDYVLFSAYEGGVFDVSDNSYVTTTATDVDFNIDKMTSVAGTKPITGTSGLDLEKAEQLARNRGEGWHIFTIAAESANQMLEVIEFGTMNGQTALGQGICNILNLGNFNQAALSGATAALGNGSGVAASTTLEDRGTITVTTDADKSAICYRGLENPWGNVWQMLNGILVYGAGNVNGGVPYICTDTNYSYFNITSNYESSGFSLPNTSSWISALGYGDIAYDWILMPAAAYNANSALPIGDSGWFTSNLSGVRMVVQGGGWSFGDSDGPFYYGCDQAPVGSSYKSYGARLLYIPTKNSTYVANINKWRAIV